MKVTVDTRQPICLKNGQLDVRKNHFDGVVEVERRGEGLFVSGREVVEVTFGESAGRSLVPSAVLRVLDEHVELVPNKWRNYEQRYVTGTVYTGSYGDETGDWFAGFHWFQGKVELVVCTDQELRGFPILVLE